MCDVNYFEMQGGFMCLLWLFFKQILHFEELPDYLSLSAISVEKGTVRNYRLLTSKIITLFDLEKQKCFSVV